MLDSATRNKIDNLRDILVGKIPDPKSQIEQITTALIYKFMNDMDRQSVEMGGVASFFVGDFEKFSWNNLMHTKLSGTERVELYSQAIETMCNNFSAPQLFRDLFKNSYLPFKEPSTLNMFLKEIGDFEYSHSERLGDAFEYLLSYMGSQGNAGQFRTPRHIIEFMVEIIKPTKSASILDPSCGTAGFLVSAFKYISDHRKSGHLTAVERKKITENVVGYDIDPNMVKIATVNLYLHNISNPNISEYDTLSSKDRWNEYFDIILANPPFFNPKGGVIPHDGFSIASNKAEVLFLDYCISHLTPEGRMAVIVPEGILESLNNSSLTNLRKKLLESGLLSIISLPVGVFNPYAKSVKTSILIFDKSKVDDENILFINVKNDGFDLGQTRKKIEKNDLPSALDLYECFEKREDLNGRFKELDWTLVSKLNVSSNPDHSLNMRQYSTKTFGEVENQVCLGEIFNIQKGSLQSNDQIDGDYDFITASSEWKTHNHYEHDTEALVYAVGASGSLGRCHYVNGKFISSNLCLILTPKNSLKKSVNLKYYYYFLNNHRRDIAANLQTGTGKKSINKKNLSNLLIPVPTKSEIDDFEIVLNEIEVIEKKIENLELELANKKKSIFT